MAKMLTLGRYLETGGVFEDIPSKYLVGVAPEWPGRTSLIAGCEFRIVEGNAFYDAHIDDEALAVGGWFIASNNAVTCCHILTDMGLSDRHWSVVLVEKNSIDVEG